MSNLFVFIHADVNYVGKTMRSGASGYVLIQTGREGSSRSVNPVTDDRFYVSEIG